MQRGRTAIIAVILFLLTLAVFWSVLGAEFVRWDDNVTIFENKNLGNLSPQRLVWAFTDVKTTMRYVPLSLVSWIVTHQYFGLNPLGYHLGNLLLHATSVSLAFIVFARLLSGNGPAKRTTSCLLAASIGAMLWGWHPLRVEPVAWCTARTYDLAMFFALITVWSYLRFAASGVGPSSFKRWMWYSISCLAYLASLLSHPVGIGLVVALFIIDVHPLQKARISWGWPDSDTRRCLVLKIPFAAASALALGLSLLARFHQSELYSGQGVPLAMFGIHQRVLQAFYLWAYYGWRPWWPVDLTPMRTELMNFQAMDARFTLSMLLVVGMTIMLFRFAWRCPTALALWIYHLIILIPVLGWTEHPHYPSDRYSLFPGLAWALAVAAGLVWIANRSRMVFAPAVTAATVLVIVLAIITVRQAAVWSNSLSLFNHMLKVLGDDPFRADIDARIGLLHALAKPPDYDRAAQAFETGMNANPRDYRLRLLLADVQTRQHRPNSAVMILKDGLTMTPDNFDLRLFLAWTLHRSQRDKEALVEFERLTRTNPDHPDVRQGLAETRKALASAPNR